MTESYLSHRQIEALLAPIKEHRVGRDGKGFSHVEAYELRAHLNRILGFGRWSEEVLEQECIFEEVTEGGGKKKWTVCYRSLVRLTVCAPDGTVLAIYTEGATGDATNQPSRADAHDLSLKTSASQAFKRCCANLGDQYGLSLYRKGSVAPLVGLTLVGRDGRETADKDLQDVAPPTFREPDPEPESKAYGTAADHAGPPEDSVPVHGPVREQTPAPRKTPDEYREALLAAQTKTDVRHLLRDLSIDGYADTETADANGNALTFAALATQRMKEAS